MEFPAMTHLVEGRRRQQQQQHISEGCLESFRGISQFTHSSVEKFLKVGPLVPSEIILCART
jgi:hypothetical protein